ncbi:MAG: methyltransferase domain-containing protein [Pseudomonadota bacterium]
MTDDARRPSSTTRHDDLNAQAAAEVRGLVQEYYGKTLARSEDLKTNACTTGAAPSARLGRLLDKLHEETRARYFGCGLVAPEGIEGARVLDLGCGAGRDVYLLAQMVGPDGFVTGVDMTAEQLEAAAAVKDWHMARFGYARPNVAFRQGYLEHLEDLPIAPGTIDVAISNCVINLVADKGACLRGLRRLMAPGGEFYFADVYADRPAPEAARRDPTLYGECLSGALEWGAFTRLASESGFAAPRLVSAAPIAPKDPALAEKLGGARFVSATCRLFAAEVGADARAETWSARYRGGVEGAEARLALDHAHAFERGVPTLVDGETASVLAQSRFAPFFDFAPGDEAARSAIDEAAQAGRPTARSPFELLDAEAPQAASGCCG